MTCIRCMETWEATLEVPCPLEMVRQSSCRRNKNQHAESYIFGADDTLPGFHWTRYFIEVQGFTVDEYVMYQDKLDKNGRELSYHCTKNIQVHYFLIKDHILVGDKTLEHPQWEICLEIASLNLCRALFSGNTVQRYKGSPSIFPIGECSKVLSPTKIWSLIKK